MKAISRISFILLMVGMLHPFTPVQAQEEFPEFPKQNYLAHVTPSVFFCGDTDGMTMEVRIVGRTDVARVSVRPGTPLYDDGTNGDLKAGDNVFTNAGMRPVCPADHIKSRGYAFWDYTLEFELKNGARYSSFYIIRIGLVDPKYRGVFEVKDFGNGLSATAYAFFIEDPKKEVFSGYPVSDIYCGLPNINAYRKLYSVLPDAFDIAMLTPGMQMYNRGLLENIPYAVTVANDVRNIGMKIQNDTAKFGSAGRLRTVIYNSFGGLDVVDHELGHVWGVQIGSKLNLVQTDRIDALDAYHWNVNSDVGGQMQLFYTETGGFGKFRPNNDGTTWRFIKNTQSEMNEPYSPLELYVMGLIGPEEVPPMHIFTSPPDMADPGRVKFESYTTITMEDIIMAEGGERIPSAADSPKNFTLAYIVAQDIPFDDAAYALHSLMAYHLITKDPPEKYTSSRQASPFRFFMPFYWATGGRATLETRLPVDVPDPAVLPDMPAAEEAATETPEPAPEPALPAATDIPPAQPTSAPEEKPAAENPSGCSLLPVGLVFLPGLLSGRRRKKY